MIRNGTPRPPDTGGGCLDAETTSPPAVIIRSFQEIPAGLKARRSLGKDQHLCQWDPLLAQELASLGPPMTTRRHIKMLPEYRDHGAVIWRGWVALQVGVRCFQPPRRPRTFCVRSSWVNGLDRNGAPASRSPPWKTSDAKPDI